MQVLFIEAIISVYSSNGYIKLFSLPFVLHNNTRHLLNLLAGCFHIADSCHTFLLLNDKATLSFALPIILSKQSISIKTKIGRCSGGQEVPYRSLYRENINVYIVTLLLVTRCFTDNQATMTKLVRKFCQIENLPPYENILNLHY